MTDAPYDAVRDMRRRLQPMAPLPTDETVRLPVLQNVRAVLFDVYGTLFTSGSGDVGADPALQSENALAAALLDAAYPGDLDKAAEFGLALLADAIGAAHDTAKADGVAHPEVEIRDVWRSVIVELIDGGLLAPSPRDHPLERLAVAYECRVNPVWPMPGLEACLRSLAGSGRVLGLVSNAQFLTPLLFPALLNATVAELGFEPDLVVWSFERREAKPGVGMFDPVLRGLTARGLAPEQAVYVGNDIRNDIWTASRAGLCTILFAGDRRSLRRRKDDENCRDAQPDAVITRLSQLEMIMPPPG